MTTQLIMGGIALAGIFALSLGRKGDAEDEAIDAAADAAIAVLNVDKDALEVVLADAVEQGDEGVMVIVIEEIAVIDDKIADIVDDATVKKDESKQKKQETQETQTKTFVDPEIARRANDRTAYNDAVAAMRASPELSVYFKVPPYEYGNWRGQMRQNTLDAEGLHEEYLAGRAAEKDKQQYDVQLGAHRASLLASKMTASDVDKYFKPLPWQFGADWTTLLADAWDDAYQNWNRDRKQVVTPTGKTAEQLSQEAYDKFVLETEAALAGKYPAGSYVMYWEQLPWVMDWDTDPDWLNEFNERYGEAAEFGIQAQLSQATAQAAQVAQAGPRSQASLMDEARFKSALAAAEAQWGADFVAPTYIEGRWESYMDQQIDAASGRNQERRLAEMRQTQARVDLERENRLRLEKAEAEELTQTNLRRERENRLRLEREEADRDAFDDRKADLYDEFPAESDLINRHMSGYRADWNQFQGQIRSELLNATHERERAAQERRNQDLIDQQRQDAEEAYQQQLADERREQLDRQEEAKQRDIQRREAEARRRRVEADAAQEVRNYQAQQQALQLEEQQAQWEMQQLQAQQQRQADERQRQANIQREMQIALMADPDNGDNGDNGLYFGGGGGERSEEEPTAPSDPAPSDPAPVDSWDQTWGDPDDWW